MDKRTVFTDPMAFTLGIYHIVTVHYLGNPLPYVDDKQQIELTWATVWPSEQFQRDDIDAVEVLKGYVRHSVEPPVRRMFRSELVQLLSWKGRVRIQQPGSNPDPFCVGFCEHFRQAATWVANGRGEPYLPWKDAQ